MMSEKEIVDIVEADYQAAMRKAYFWSRAAIVAVLTVSLLTGLCLANSLIPLEQAGAAGTWLHLTLLEQPAPCVSPAQDMKAHKA